MTYLHYKLNFSIKICIAIGFMFSCSRIPHANYRQILRCL